LFETGMLADAEREFLLRRWRKDFDKAQPDDFQLCVGHGHPDGPWLKGDEAKQAHYRWAGIPLSLLKLWIAERRRQGRTVRKLKAETMPPLSKEAPR
jgi:hypothetical protein